MSIEVGKDFRWLKRCTPPQLVVIEFDGKDVVCESTGGSGGFDAVIKPPTDIEIEIPMG